MSKSTLDGPIGHLTIQFLEWLSARPRTYGDAMDAWRTSCPRLSLGRCAIDWVSSPRSWELSGKAGHYHGTRSISPSQPVCN